jgi:hypothetical protein
MGNLRGVELYYLLVKTWKDSLVCARRSSVKEFPSQQGSYLLTEQQLFFPSKS